MHTATKRAEKETTKVLALLPSLASTALGSFASKIEHRTIARSPQHCTRGSPFTRCPCARSIKAWLSPILLFISEKGGEGGKREKRGATLFLCCVTYAQPMVRLGTAQREAKPGRHTRGSVISSLLFTSLVRGSHTWLHTCTTIPCNAVLESFVAFTRQTSNTARVGKKKSSVVRTGVVGIHRSP